MLFIPSQRVPVDSATRIVDNAIQGSVPQGCYDDLRRANLIADFAAGRPAVMTTGGYSNQAAANAADAIHRGEDLTTWIMERAVEQRRDLTWYATAVLDNLISLNDAGDPMLARARQKLLVEGRSTV